MKTKGANQMTNKKIEKELMEEVEEKEKNSDEELIESNEDEELEEIEETKEEEQQDDTTKKLLRLQADFLNYKNRVEREKSRLYSSGIEDVICEFLPILDNFDRALNANEKSDSFKEGVQMIYSQFKQAMEKKGLKEIEAIGKHFDPNLHHAVAVEALDDVESNIVVEVLQKGYVVNDKVIRPSMVKVSR
jgi:molecular chaperone GrpE